MFTGLIERTGEVAESHVKDHGGQLTIQCSISSPELGESIAVNGVCLTLQSISLNRLSFDVSKETLRCTTLGVLRSGCLVNLERAMQLNTRYGGHYVTGHVDTTKVVRTMTKEGRYIELSIGEFTQDELNYLTHKGSITIDGVSLTINAVENDRIKLLLVPHTLLATNLKQRNIGDRVNVEFDYLAKMVSHQVERAIQYRLKSSETEL
ncbi:riboflavin synthase [Legionella impletisoli]|uniref:Riboflavin synthase n=1 Tax=Legionella impletisoli TaxID=343510 RepID=A0A917JPT1_9GAMM|nr:riboflavin synthase [Legionella impletisoli]GGI77609.1 riboflavin synthase subunit alpha [Legionella impletisoli]